MLPSLIAFSKDTGLDASCYLRARDLAWERLQGKAGSTVDLARLNELCLKSAPDTEDFTHEQTSFALNAAITMSDVLEFMLNGNADLIAHVSTLATDSVYLYLSCLEPRQITANGSIKSLLTAKEAQEKVKRIASYPLMRQEVERQQEDIKFLSELPDRFDAKAISTLKARATNQLPLLPAAFTAL